jgi:uncharacterized RDD family membrane protein YckC
MACPRCGDICRCDPEARCAKTRPKFEPHFELDAAGEAPRVSAHGVLVDQEAFDASEQPSAASPEGLQPSLPRFVVDLPSRPTANDQPEKASNRPADIHDSEASAVLKPPAHVGGLPTADESQVGVAVQVVAKTDAESRNPDSWRQEVAARLHRYHSRRKPRAPRYPSLRLKFEASEHGWTDSSRIADSVAHTTPVGSRSVSPSAASPWTMAQVLAAREEPVTAPSLAVTQIETVAQPAPVPLDLIGNVIEFPRWNPGPPAPVNELAEPVIERPRIMEAPEVTPLPPALGGILIESAPEPEIAKQPGIDLPLQSASLERRLLAAAIDAVTVGAAGVLFGYVVFRVSAPRLPLLQMAGVGVALMGFLWAAYQYLFLVHTASTPGLRLTKLELCRFDGTPAGQRVRRWRVLISLLSAASLGLGYAWYFLDEDALCWHDRITHTYLGSVSRSAGRKS